MLVIFIVELLWIIMSKNPAEQNQRLYLMLTSRSLAADLVWLGPPGPPSVGCASSSEWCPDGREWRHSCTTQAGSDSWITGRRVHRSDCKGKKKFREVSDLRECHQCNIPTLLFITWCLEDIYNIPDIKHIYVVRTTSICAECLNP